MRIGNYYLDMGQSFGGQCMNKLLILLFLVSTPIWAKSKHPIYDQILRNKPKINKRYAMRLSNVIHRVSLKYKLPKHVFTAILCQESGYRLNALGKATGLLKGKKVTVHTDYGISQIHWKNVKKHDLDVDLLLTDMVYSVTAGAKILAGFKRRYAKKDPIYWARYNCGSRGSTKRDTCQIYVKLVERYL